MSGQEEGKVTRVRSRGLTSENKFSTISLFLRNGNLHHCWLQWPENAEMHRLLAESNRSQRYIDARWLNVHLIKSRPRPWHSFHRVVCFLSLWGTTSYPFLLSTGRQISRIFSQTSFPPSEIFLHLCLPTDLLEQHSVDWFAILSDSLNDIIKRLFSPSSLTIGNSWSDC